MQQKSTCRFLHQYSDYHWPVKAKSLRKPSHCWFTNWLRTLELKRCWNQCCHTSNYYSMQPISSSSNEQQSTTIIYCMYAQYMITINPNAKHKHACVSWTLTESWFWPNHKTKSSEKNLLQESRADFQKIVSCCKKFHSGSESKWKKRFSCLI